MLLLLFAELLTDKYRDISRKAHPLLSLPGRKAGDFIVQFQQDTHIHLGFRS